MSKSAQTKLNKTTDIKTPNLYVKAFYNEFKDWSFDEQGGVKFKGCWRKKVFKKSESQLLHLEIGPGNGLSFFRRCQNQPQDSFLAVELKYKPLIQTIRRVRSADLTNVRVIRYNANLIKDLFAKEELNNIYIHFPDPWPKRKQNKHQLINAGFAADLFQIQQTNSLLEFKTDSEKYFSKTKDIFFKAGYKVLVCNTDLHSDKTKEQGFFQTLSQFELLFVKKNIPIKYLLMKKYLK